MSIQLHFHFYCHYFSFSEIWKDLKCKYFPVFWTERLCIKLISIQFIHQLYSLTPVPVHQSTTGPCVDEPSALTLVSTGN